MQIKQGRVMKRPNLWSFKAELQNGCGWKGPLESPSPAWAIINVFCYPCLRTSFWKKHLFLTALWDKLVEMLVNSDAAQGRTNWSFCHPIWYECSKGCGQCVFSSVDTQQTGPGLRDRWHCGPLPKLELLTDNIGILSKNPFDPNWMCFVKPEVAWDDVGLNCCWSNPCCHPLYIQSKVI